jgi:hypothetical protein
MARSSWPAFGEVTGEVRVLAGKVLVDEGDAHG